ncbi:T9SS type B sorting domain-containing protein [Bacteroidota bacterium]
MRTLNKILSLFFLLIFCIQLSYSQGEGSRAGNIWYFGKNAALDFNKWVPVAIDGSQMVAREGCASISDNDGNLLFYTDGITVWNYQHDTIANGDGLYGSPTSTQAGVIVPKPGDDGKYYVFTVDKFEGGKGLRYSIVDMTVPGGRIKSTEKNLKMPFLLGNEIFTEKITSVKHGREDSYWIITHLWGGKTFYVYKVTKDKINKPLPYESGIDHGRPGTTEDKTEESIGYIKVSPKGHYLAAAIEGLGKIQLFNFNSITGYIPPSPFATIDLDQAYGMEFSISEEFLYTSQRKQKTYINQFDITSRNQNTILNSRTEIGFIQGLPGALQLAPNGKIYLSVSSKDYLSVIFSPNKRGMSSGFRKKGVSLGNGESKLGLPTFVSTFFEGDGFIYSDICLGDETQFYFTSIYDADEMLWDFGDGSTSDEVHPTHTYRDPDQYKVVLTTKRAGEVFTTIKYINVFPVPIIEFEGGYDQILCKGTELELIPTEGNFYLWNTGAESQTIKVNTPGTYSVTLTDFNLCMATGEVEVTEFDLPEVDSVQTIKASCGGDNGSATVYPVGNPDSLLYLWSTVPEQTTRTATNLRYGRYTVKIISPVTGCIKEIDNVIISEMDGPEIYIESLQPADPVCPEIPFKLVAHGAQNYTWQNDAVGDTITVYPLVDTIYSVTGTSWVGNEGKQECSGVADIAVNVYPQQGLDLGEDQEKCLGEEVILDAGNRVSWLWQDSSTQQTFFVDTTGTYFVSVSDEYNCIISDSVDLIFHPHPPLELGADSTSCMGNSILLDAGEGEIYLWADSSDSRYYDVSETGNYSVEVTNEYGCTAIDDISLIFYSMDSMRIDSIVKSDISCYGFGNGEINIYAYGLVGYFNYSIDGGETWEDNGGSFSNLSAGQDYDIRVKERHACEKSWPDKIQIIEPDELIVNSTVRLPTCDDCSDGKISLNISGGIPPYTYNWINYETSPVLSDVSIGTYSVTVRDSLSCNQQYRININYSEDPFLGIPSAFTPNNDGINDLWDIKNVDDYPNIIIKVFDSYGKLIYTSPTGYPSPWDGTTNGKSLPTNSYYYVIDLGTGADFLKGAITIIK